MTGRATTTDSAPAPFSLTARRASTPEYCRDKLWSRPGSALSGVPLLLAVLVSAPDAPAEDADRQRSYLHFRSGEFDSSWGVHDHWGLSFGMNFNRYWGIELSGDVFESYLALGEMAVNGITPQVRLRYPLMKDQLVPYAIFGVGAVVMEMNDRKPSAIGHIVEGKGVRPGFTAGAGIEYFLDDNLAFVVEGKYLWADSLDITVDGVPQPFDASSWLATIGLRIYFDENHPRILAEQETRIPSRFYFAASYGAFLITDGDIGSGLTLDNEESAFLDTFNQYSGMALGMNFGENWGVELSVSGGELMMKYGASGEIGEYAIVWGIPKLRVRVPLAGGRLIPFFKGGIGGVYGEFNDARGIPTYVDAEGIYPAISVGGGFEYFITRNFSLGAEVGWQYSWGHEFVIGNNPASGDLSGFQIQIGFHAYLFEGRKSK